MPFDRGAATALPTPIVTVQEVPPHRAVPGRTSSTTLTASPPRPINSATGGTIITGDCTNDITYYPTNAEVWDSWNAVYTLTTQVVNSGATVNQAVYTLQAGLNALAMEAQMVGDTWGAWNIRYVADSITVTSTTAATSTLTIGTAPLQANIYVWENWCDQFQAEATDRENQIRRDIAAGRQPSAEQREQWRQEELRRRQAEENRLKDELAAKDKAIVLLKSCLTKQQLEEYERKKHFHLHVGGKVYRIEQGSHGNVKLIDKDGKVRRSFCIQPRGVPDGDAMLAQKLMLETDEKGFYERANVTEYDDKGQHLGTFRGVQAVDLLNRTQQRAG